MSVLYNNDPRTRRRNRRKIAIGIVVVITAGVGIFFAVRPGKVNHAGESIGFTSPPTPTVKAEERVVIMRGGTTGCLPAGGCNDANFASVLAFREAWTATVIPGGGIGYVAGATTKPPSNFATKVPLIVKAKPSLVIIQGSATDQYFSSDQIRAAAQSLYAAIAAKLPKAKIVVVGPAYSGKVPADILGVEQGLQQATAAGRVALFIDPIAEDWFGGKNAGLMASDHVSPTDAGHQLMATRIMADLTKAKLSATA